MYEGIGSARLKPMATAPDSVTLDEDVHEELRKLAKRSGRPLGALANEALRDFVRYESEVAAAIERGIADLDAGRTRTTADVFAFLEQQRLARKSG
jgi:predicted transcriptional regulator